MSVDDVINSVLDDAGEWIEMSENPDGFVIGVLAARLAKAQETIEWLQRRLSHYDSIEIRDGTGNPGVAGFKKVKDHCNGCGDRHGSESMEE